MSHSRAVLVTGCSSGIGHAIAVRLHRAGYPVYASGRRAADLADLAAAGITTLQLDVTDEASMQAAVKQVSDAHGAVGALVNNAGYGLFGALEEVPLDAVRAQFATNVFGALRLIQLVLLPSIVGPVPDRKIAVTGTLFGAHGEHHRTRVLLYVKAINGAYESR